MPYITVANRKIFYAEHNVRAGSGAVILIHGAAANHLVWPGPVRRLPNRRVLALDLPGHGRSQPPGRRLITHYAEVVCEFIRALHLEKVILLGHSMGGAIALQLAADTGHAIHGVIVVGTAMRMRVSERLLSESLADTPQAIESILSNGFSDATPQLLNRCREQMRSISPTTFFGDFLACNRFDLRDRVAEIMVPTLVISGTADNMVHTRFSATLADGLPNGDLALIEGAGHFTMLERPYQVAEIAESFIARLA